MNSIKVSILICTRNNAANLRQTLASLMSHAASRVGTVEVLVIDNGSSNNTRDVVTETVSANNGPLQVRYILEPKAGQVYARNTGVAEARGKVLLFTDDDVRTPEGWIDGMCEPILSGEADAVAGGVEIAPELLRPWMTPEHRAALFNTADMFGDNDLPDLIGANMAIGRHAFAAINGFDPELGPGALGFWDDSLFGKQMRSAGMRIVRRQDVCVEHHFNPDRLTRAAHLRRAAAHGVSGAYVRYHYYHDRVKLPGVRVALCWLKLGVWRLFHPACFTNEGFDLREGMFVYALYSARQMQREQRRERNYVRQGLRKLRGNPVSFQTRVAI